MRDTVLLSGALVIAGIVMLGATRFSVGYLPVVLLPLLPWAATLLSRTVPPRGANRLAGIAIVTLAVLIAGRVFALSNGGISANDQRRELWPYAGLAEAIKQRGLDRGTIVATNRDAGNLHAFLPQVRALPIVRLASLHIPQRSDHGMTCAVLWQDLSAVPAGARWRDEDATLLLSLIPSLAARPREAIDVRWPPTMLGQRRTTRWLLVRLPADDDVCRRPPRLVPKAVD